jgi:hypothetical protein
MFIRAIAWSINRYSRRFYWIKYLSLVKMSCQTRLLRLFLVVLYSFHISFLGPTGIGKTVIMANLNNQIEKLYPTATIVTRFIRETFDNVRQLLESILNQISTATSTNDYFINLKTNLPLAMRQSASISSPLIILLDGVNDLGYEYAGDLLNWIPSRLPPHTCLVLSTSSSITPIASLDWQIISVTLLSIIEVDLLIAQVCGSNTGDVFESVKRDVNYNPSVNSTPLFIKLAVQWHSFYSPFTRKHASSPSFPPKDISDIEIMPVPISDSVESIVRGIFEITELEMNREFVTRALGYITAAKNGITVVELDAILNCDDAVVRACMVLINL